LACPAAERRATQTQAGSTCCPAPTNEDNDRFGAALGIGKFASSSKFDLLVGAPGEAIKATDDGPEEVNAGKACVLPSVLGTVSNAFCFTQN
jgi:hypothetical protein